MRVADNIAELIGQTPVLKLHRVIGPVDAEVYAKLEFFNPGSSIKDRVALNMLDVAAEQGLLKEDTVLVEPTSGNTGIGLAMLAAARGYRLVLVMPDTMSMERRNLLKAYGAELVLTPGSKGMSGAVEKAERLVKENKNYFMPQQFTNPANPASHRQSTAQELVQQFPQGLDAVVASVGTGGTVTGIGEILKAKWPKVQIFAVEPADSPVLSGGKPGPHKIQGIGAGFVPEIFKRELVDQILTVTNEAAMQTAKAMAQQEGALVGISSGAAVWAAIQVARKLGGGKKILAICPDSGERYLSTELFD